MKKSGFLFFVTPILYCTTVCAEESIDWSGPYVGTNIGVTQSSGDSKLSIHKGAAPFLATTIKGLEDDGTGTQSSTSVNVGAHAGYNYQFQDQIFGIELGYGYLGSRMSKSVTAKNIGAPAYSHTLTSSADTSWLLRLQPKIGYAFDNFLVEANCGLAFTDFSVSQSYLDTLPRSDYAETSSIKVGVIAGASLAYALTKEWSVKGEYYYTEFGRVQASSAYTQGGTVQSGTFNPSYNLTAHVAQLAVNYKF